MQIMYVRVLTAIAMLAALMGTAHAQSAGDQGSFGIERGTGNIICTGDTDMVLFSVRRGSPVVGMPDSIFGIPIADGDILTTPLPTSMGGVSPFPGIFCA
ncbi:MAG: hypothetical protein L3J02_07095, partial [Henriciella sp.]|nr:hypothetical protein [Henriciella sp.]